MQNVTADDPDLLNKAALKPAACARCPLNFKPLCYNIIKAVICKKTFTRIIMLKLTLPKVICTDNTDVSNPLTVHALI